MRKNSITILKSLADETRFQILATIRFKEKTVTDIVKTVRKAQPTVSLHLKFLLATNIISVREHGRYKYYKLTNNTAKRILKILHGRR